MPLLKSFGKLTAAFATICVQKRASMEYAMEHKYLDFQFILNTLAGSLVVLTAEGDLLLTNRTSWRSGVASSWIWRHAAGSWQHTR